MTNTLLLDTDVNTFIQQQTRESFYYSEEWLKLITELYGYALIPLTTVNAAGQINGYLPLCSMQSPLTGQRLVSLPFSDFCPLLASDEASANDLVERAIHLAQQHRAKYLELRSGVNATLAKRADLVEDNLYVRWVLALEVDAGAQWSALRKPVQRQIKKAQNQGVQVRFASTRKEVRHYYDLHLLTRSKKHGMPAQPLNFFLGLWDAFATSGAMQVLLAEYQGAIIAGMVLFASGSTVRYAYGASDERYLALAPNNLLLWSAIEWGSAHGYASFDLGRTARDNEGLMEYKRRWGASMEPLPYYYYPQMQGLAATPESSWKYRVLTGCWKRLPLPVAKTLGGRLYKHLG